MASRKVNEAQTSCNSTSATTNSKEDSPTKVLKICTYYNSKNTCTAKECQALHVCFHYVVRSNCSFGERCKKSHNVLDSQPIALLRKYGIDVGKPVETIRQEIKKQYPPQRATGAQPINLPSDRRTAETDEDIQQICRYFLCGTCKFGEKVCRRKHVEQPYCWQYNNQVNGDSAWRDFDISNSKVIETIFNDVNKGDYTVRLSSGEKIKIDFDTWCATSSTTNGKCRRLGTHSWGDTPLHRPYVTKWCWYWLDEFGKWIEYGKQEGSHISSDLTSKEIEEKYLENAEDLYEFKAGSNEYILDFKGQQQINKVFKTVRKVRRRPDKEVKSIIDPNKKRVDNLYPKNWSQQSNPAFQMVDVSTGSDDYNEITLLFSKTMANDIIKITRIQTPELWEDYARKMEKMKKKSPDGKVKERRLFHGTDETAISDICQQGFDFRLAGTRVGAIYGGGIYYARDAIYSNGYTKCGKMFVAKVLVGEYCQGSQPYTTPPCKDPVNPLVFFDSCVDDPLNPSIFVIFDNSQCYPEYLIEYKR